ncbi:MULTISPECIES: transcriptional regulator SlyA [Shewanella]|uniref:MarR family transcriptional regulator n=1 Tax=Shewanella fodinae TaxID=552357 RepID=A0A4R2F972_9GAMM|nr:MULTISPECIES: transcriptional regulator SlyA [Shewanella]MBO1272547.1 transcriptional regulator SlyA [Shewanella sp. 4t3-1-2LB]MCD8475485.1 transcriptional regulator SlyA [Shewanella fodinae]MCL2906473.1 transcriptional regulator SlyA [Shewanella fodinae]TCN79590.1 MarR family transcriptional regulator [Shewanella fodinae]GGY93443.1 MarR family transcriptional regulator [Shewanella fodinae]
MDKLLDHLRELSLAEHLGRSHRLWRMVADAKLVPLGLTHPRWTALWKLRRMGDGVGQKALADALEIELPSLMRTLAQLEQQQLILRHCCDQDKRARIVWLTDAGRQLLDQMETLIVQVRLDLLDGISEAELTQFEQILQRITNNAQRQLAAKK